MLACNFVYFLFSFAISHSIPHPHLVTIPQFSHLRACGSPAISSCLINTLETVAPVQQPAAPQQQFQNSLHYQATDALHFNQTQSQQPVYAVHQQGYNQQQPFADPYNSNQFSLLPSNSGALAGAGTAAAGNGNWPAQQQQLQQPQYDQQMPMDSNAAAFPNQQANAFNQMGGGGGGGEMFGQGVSGTQPRNNAFLEQQQQNKNQSPAQAADETSRRGLRSADGQSNIVNNQLGGDQEVR